MSQEEWHGIPRKEIPWYPTIDYKKCVGCGKCVDYCKLGTYEFDQKNGKQTSVVKNPYNCVVLCTGCDDVCPEGAISHPSKEEARHTIADLRKKHKLSPSETEEE
jgi:NAD-dependent dihydropyrimidine dehydrogenase PreA subunit